MSATPDYMTQLLSGGNTQGLNGMFTNSMYSPQMGLALGLLQAGGPSRMPVSLGQALGQGMQTGQQFQGAGLQNAMQRLMLGQNIQGMNALQDAYGPNANSAPVPAAFQQYAPAQNAQPSGLPPQPNTATTQVAPAVGTAAASTSNGLPAQAAQQSPTPQAPALQAAPANWAPLSQISRDNRTLDALSRSPMWKDQAAALRDRMQNTYYDMTPEMVQKFTGAPPEKGYGYQINELGQVKPVGESIYMPVSGQGPNGTYQQGVFNKTNGQTTWPTNNASQRTPGTPLTNPADENYAQGLAEYKYKPPAVGQRNSGQALNWLARANELNPAFDENAYDAKHAAYLSMAAGKDYQTNSSYSTIQTHFDTLKQAFGALQNGDYQDANKLIQWSGKKFGKDAATNASLVSDIVNGEFAKVLAQGGQVTDSVRAESNKALAPYFSNGQIAGGIQYAQQLIAGKMNTSYVNAMASKIPEDVWMAHITPEARQQLQIFRQSHPDNGTANGAPKVMNYDPATGKIQ